MNYCQWYERLDQENLSEWGEAALNLKKVSKIGVTIVPGFVISSQLYNDWLVKSAFGRQVQNSLNSLNLHRPQELAGLIKDIQLSFKKATFSATAQKELSFFWQEFQKNQLKLKGGIARLVVSASVEGEYLELTGLIKDAEDLQKLLISFYLHSLQENKVERRLRKKENLLGHAFPIIVQEYSVPEYSGLAQCYDPQQHDELTIHIAATHQQRHPNPHFTIEDEYLVDKKSLLLLSRQINKQWWSHDGEGGYFSPAHFGKGLATLSDKLAVSLAKKIRQASQAFDEIMQFSWIYAHQQFFITSVKDYSVGATGGEEEMGSPLPLLKGLPGSAGIISGPARLIKTKQDLAGLKNKEIAVLELLTTSQQAALAGVAGIITETGTLVSDEAQVAKGLGVPAVVATRTALSHLKNGQMVTIDGGNGLVYAGKRSHKEVVGYNHEPQLNNLGTKIYALVDNPFAGTLQKVRQTDGIGLLRGEFIIRMLGMHPQDVITKKRSHEYIEVLVEGLEAALEVASTKPVIYQLHDSGSADLLGLRARHQDRHEPNPLLGYRGAHRLIKEPEVLDLELKALTRLARQGYTNLSLMIPMARTLTELDEIMQYLSKSTFMQEYSVPVWLKCETPALLIQMEEVVQRKLAGIHFDIGSLSQLVLGFDKENRQVGHYVDQTDQAIIQSLRFGIATTREAGISTTVGIEADTLRPEIIQVAVESHVSGITAPAEQADELAGLIGALEHRLMVEYITE